MFSGCGTKESESTEKTSDNQAVVTDAATGMVTKPSGVRYIDMEMGSGPEVVDSMFLEFDFTLWFTDQGGMIKEVQFATSINRPQDKFVGQVGVSTIPGLTDGLRGMRVGGIREIYIPWELGWGEEGPFPRQNLCFRVENLKPLPREQVLEHWAQKERERAYFEARNDSLRRVHDSLDQDVPPGATRVYPESSGTGGD
jgi:hypothetical protein